MKIRPLIGLLCDVKPIDQWDFHAVGNQYIRAIQYAVGDVVLLPALADELALRRLLPLLDGLVFPGSHSNVEPHHYQDIVADPAMRYDAKRDQTTLPLIRRIITQGIPLLGICRGLQEINVALGGSLHQQVQQLPHYLDHREVKSTDMAVKYAPAHTVEVCSDSWLYQWLGLNRFQVNSLHQQGIKDLASGLTAEAYAPDGLIEAIRLHICPIFGYAVQWHPEWQYDQNPVSKAIFKAFHNACMQYKAQKSISLI